MPEAVKVGIRTPKAGRIAVVGLAAAGMAVAVGMVMAQGGGEWASA